MAKVTSEEYYEKWGRRLKGATTDIQRGVERVTMAPGQKAAQKQQKMLTNLTESVNNGTWAKKVAAVDLPTWQSKMINKGIQRISSGVDGAHDKSVQFADKLLPHVDAGKQKIAGMADLSFQDNMQRMVAFSEHMHTLKGK